MNSLFFEAQKPGLRVIIAGSRNITDYDIVKKAITVSFGLMAWDIVQIVSGGASGVDHLGERYAKENNIPLRVFPAQWYTYGRSAGARRNGVMACNADALIAITNGSPGTANMIKLAMKKKLQTFVYEVKPCETQTVEARKRFGKILEMK